MVGLYRSAGVSEKSDGSHVATEAGNRNFDLGVGDDEAGLGMDGAHLGFATGGMNVGGKEEGRDDPGSTESSQGGRGVVHGGKLALS